MKKSRLAPLWSAVLIFLAAEALTVYTAFREKDFVEVNQIESPQYTLAYPVVYFFDVVSVMGAILFLIPVSKLRLVLKAMFAFLFAWGTFVVLGLSLPFYVAISVAAVAGLFWLFKPKVWLHNLLMILALVSAGTVFGFVLSPWAAMGSMLVLSIYDFLAVRFGYMLWMARKLSESDTLPVFLIPARFSAWKMHMRANQAFTTATGEREFSILGGGDIGFPLLLMVSVFFGYGTGNALIVAGFAVIGLISAYLIQIYLLKGKPMPALPPITFWSLIGFLIVYFR
ncbi:MAG: presenilin family intramembrane aspartyl protease [Dehalococcoidales bacterium]|nr:presenilin family intramembrane aspartyl protease [Dehalococcoidales bacterium]